MNVFKKPLPQSVRDWIQEIPARALRCDPSYQLSRALFLRFLGIIYLCAFGSLWVQIDGLLGSEGILPAERLLTAARQQLGPERYWHFPSLFWLYPADLTLHLLCGSGVVFSLLLIAGLLPRLILLLLWATYLSLLAIGQDFLSFQWDVLLLETGFLAVFLAPKAVRFTLTKAAPPVILSLLLLRVLLFKLMFQSGVVKLASGDPTWRGLTALRYHYETQPLPTRLGWYAHQLPEALQELSVLLMFVIELAIPFLIFAPRKWRLFASANFLFLQALILLTGNYGFFNLLAVSLSLLLLDDTIWRRLLPQRMESEANVPQSAPVRGVKGWAVLSLAAILMAVSGVQVINTAVFRGDLPRPLQQVLVWLAPCRTVNSYGLFAVMTTVRNEIIVEGSNDQKIWHAYEFKWKPGDLYRPPGWVAPHQPRLDWQMWFAALRRYDQVPWFANFLTRLLEGSPPVLRLLASNPFPETPPKYVRARLYEYRFSHFKGKAATGAWWRREFKGWYCPVFSLRR